MKPEPAPRRIPDKVTYNFHVKLKLILSFNYIFKLGKGGIFKDRALKDAFDILAMSYRNPLILTYSSGFGALALQLKQVKDNFCSNWASLDWGKREWPAIGTIGHGGVRGVKLGTDLTSKLCYVDCDRCEKPENSYCTVLLNVRKKNIAPIFSICNC